MVNTALIVSKKYSTITTVPADFGIAHADNRCLLWEKSTLQGVVFKNIKLPPPGAGLAWRERGWG
jgi:hypothetical protein